MREAFFNEKGVRGLAADLRRAWPSFEAASFLRAILPRLPPLGLNERNFLIRDALHVHLPPAFPDAAKILLRALEPESSAGFAVMSLGAYVAEHGLAHRDLALAALKEITKRFSAEFAIRPFLDREPDAVLATLAGWAHDPDAQVRRLVSEGTRPRLPWGMRLQGFVKDPRPVLKLLDLLKEDPELFVRRSVANNLNDIAKDHPDLVVATLRRWKSSRSPETQWLVKHALRTLIKQGHPEALGLLGFGHGAAVRVTGLTLAHPRLRIGETQAFQFTVTSTAKEAQPLMIDYALHYRKANGQLKPKVFKLKSLMIGPRASVQVEKRQPFRPIGIRPFYPGGHVIEILINGRAMGRAEFHLRPPT
jgi:3-methyladenine DNA glycosylase AlkC